MDEFEEIFDTLDEYYAYICNDNCECDKEETLKFIEEYKNVDNMEFLIRPIEEVDSEDDDELDTEEEDIDEDDSEYDEEYIEYDNIDSLINEINCYDDEQYFEIMIPDNLLDDFISKKFRDFIFSNEFTNNERLIIIKSLMDASIKYINDDQILETDKEKYSSFCKRCSLNDFISKYINDDNFCVFISDIYEVMADNIVLENDISIKTINDMVREVLINIYKYNISNFNYNDFDSKMVLVSYFYNEIDNTKFNEKYKSILKNNKIEDLFNKNYAKIVIITDYIRYNSTEIISSMEKKFIDITNLIYVMSNSRKNIINRFNNDPNFAFNVISGFIDLNIYFDNYIKRDCTDKKIIKKINPFYYLDFKSK